MELAEAFRWIGAAVLLAVAVVLSIKGVRLMSRAGRADFDQQSPDRERLDVEGEGFRTIVLAAFVLVASAGVAVLPGLAA